MKAKNSWFILVLLLVFITSACDDKFEEINTNPNSVTDVDNEYLFANAVLQTLRSSANRSLQFPWGSQYGHIYVGRNNYLFIDRYYDYFESVEYQYLFENFYHGPIRLVAETLRLTEPGGEEENEVRHAMAQVVAMINYAHLADAFGSIPYRQGGLGQAGVIFPEYDSVEFIYTDMLEKLKDIVSLLKTADPAMGYPGADPLYDNDLTSWTRFANSFRFRLAMRIRFVNTSLAQTVISECLSEPLIEDNSQNAWNENIDSDIGEFSNPIYGQYNYWAWKMSELFVDALKTSSDPRLPIFVKPNNDGEYVGIPNGLSDASLTLWNWGNVSAPTDILVGKAAPIYNMAAAEIWFLKAEAALFNISSGDANEFYRTGIEKSFEQWGVSQEDIDDYLTNATSANLSGTQEEKFEQICTQLWISFMSNEFEGWSNIRRTGYPKIPVRTEPMFSIGVTNGEMPSRLKYPSSEVNINNENYQKAINEQGPDEITTPLWWDVRN